MPPKIKTFKNTGI